MEKLCAYASKWVFPVGNVVVFNAGWTTEKDYVCETVIIPHLFRTNTRPSGERFAVSKGDHRDVQHSNQETSEEDLLNVFMRDGLELAKAKILEKIRFYFQDHKDLIYPIELKKQNSLNAAMHIMRVNASDLDWYSRVTQSKLAANVIRDSRLYFDKYGRFRTISL